MKLVLILAFDRLSSLVIVLIRNNKPISLVGDLKDRSSNLQLNYNLQLLIRDNSVDYQQDLSLSNT